MGLSWIKLVGFHCFFFPFLFIVEKTSLENIYIFFSSDLNLYSHSCTFAKYELSTA